MKTACVEPLESRQLMSVSLGTNLVLNGNAEAAANAFPGPNSLLPGWKGQGPFTIEQYGKPGMPNHHSPGPNPRGFNFFSGGVVGVPGLVENGSSAYQDIDVASFAPDIDAGRITYDFSAYLGGYGREADTMHVNVMFLSRDGATVAHGLLNGPPPIERQNTTGLVRKSLDGRLPAGTRTIRVMLNAARSFGQYIDGYADNIELELDSTTPHAYGFVAGRVVNDANGNGKLDRDETGVAGAGVFADLDKDGKVGRNEPKAVTKADGTYELNAVPAGTVVVRRVAPQGFRATGPSLRTVRVAGGLTTVGHSFLASATSVITGSIFDDQNGNGKRERSEDGRAFVSVFLDTNDNGKLDAREPRTRTDENGNFSFIVPAGKYTIRARESATLSKQTLPAKRKGIAVTLASGAKSAGNVFGLKPIAQ